MSQASRANARAIFDEAVAAVQPDAAMCSANLRELMQAATQANRIIVVGGGKAGAGMLLALEKLLFDQLERIEGIVNVPDDLVVPTRRIRLNPSRPRGRNEPTSAACAAAEQMLQLVRSADSHSLVIVLLSGGGSALLPLPVHGITLTDKIAITRGLSLAGASIQELNCVRKHLSQIKGGRLAEAASHTGSIWGLIISDVVGDPLDVIASGPTAPDPSTFGDALPVLKKYKLDSLVPAVTQFLQQGVDGIHRETPKELLSKVHNKIIANNLVALRAAEKMATDLGYEVTTWPSPVVGDAVAAARMLAANIPQIKGRTCLLFGGETTVKLGSANGLGGRNQELALAMAAELSTNGLENVTILCCGTDGEDGPTDAAGACIDAELWSNAIAASQNPADFLQNHDSYHFFEPIDGLVKTGLTGTNVMDIGCILVERM